MKRVTLNQLANQMEEDLGWYDYFVGQVYNGNHSHCKEVLNSLSKKETLEVIRVCVDELDESEYSDYCHHKPSVRRLYNYAMESLKERL